MIIPIINENKIDVLKSRKIKSQVIKNKIKSNRAQKPDQEFITENCIRNKNKAKKIKPKILKYLAIIN